jgi:hypothetical protein
MIESGLRSWVLANTSLRPLLGQSAQQTNSGLWTSFFYSFLPKPFILPAIVLDRVSSGEADDTLDVRTAAPGTMIEARFQFGCMANDNVENPTNPSGYLSALLLSRALRLQIMSLATGDSYLPDGTLLNDIRIDDEFDAHFEVGGESYLYRRVLKVTILYTETSEPVPTPNFWEGYGAPTALESNEDIYFDESTGNIYEQVAAAWVLVGNVPQGGETEMPSLISHTVSAASDNAAIIKASAGVVTGWKVYNNSNYPVFVKLFDTPATPTPASTKPKQVIGVDAGDSDVSNSAGFGYTTGIGIAIVKGIADFNDTAVAANDCVVDIFYQ